MNLDKLAVGVETSLLVQRRLRRTRTDYRVRGLAKNRPVAAGRDDDRIRGKSAYFHGTQIHGANAAADLLGIEHGREEFPVFVFLDLAFGLVAAHLLIEGVQELLPCGGAGERGAVVERPTKPAKIQQAFRGAIERHAHAVEQVNNAGRSLAHRLHRRLVGQEVSAVNGVVEMLPGGVTLALQVFRGVNSTLRAYRM